MAQKIPDFALKIDHLKGILGAYLPADSFKDKRHAEICHISQSNYNHKKTGRKPFQPEELGRLIHLFQLEPEFTYADLYLPFEEFDAKLRKNGIGSYSEDPAVVLCDRLAKLADPAMPITIRKIATKDEIGGIGRDPSGPNIPQLREGDHVQLFVPIPNTWPDGHLLVLNFSPLRRGGVTYLMPSPYAPFTDVRPQKTMLPTLDSVRGSFPVALPAGPRPIFAIWTEESPDQYVPLSEDCGVQMMKLSAQEILAISDVIKETLESEDPKLAVFRADYTVG